MNTEDKIKAGDQIINLMSKLIGSHIERILESYSKTDESLPINLRFTLKGDDEKISITSTLSYATERVKDHANATIDVRQGTLDFEDEESAEAA